METLPDTQSESQTEPSPNSEEDGEVDPRVPVRFFSSLTLTFSLNYFCTI